MKRIFIPLIVASMFGSCKKDIEVQPDQSEFMKYYGTAGDETARAVKTVGDTDIAVCGYGFNPVTGDDDPFILLLDKNGEQRWMKYFGGAGNEICWSFDVRPDWGFIIASQSGGTNKDFQVTKTNSDGNVTWTRNYGSPYEDFPTKVICVNDGYLVCGISNSGHDNNAWMLRLNANGDSLWSYNWGTNGDDGAMNLCRNADGSFAVVGYTNGSNLGSTDGFLLLLNDSGHEIQHYIFGTNEYDEPHAIVSSPNGWYITGHQGSSADISTHDVFLTRINSAGTQEWNKKYGGAMHDGGEDMCMVNGKLSVIGRSMSHDGYDQDNILLEMNSDGILLDERWLGTTADDAGYGIGVDNTDLLYCGYSLGGPFGGKDICIARKKIK